MAAVAEVSKLELEIKELAKKRGEVEFRLRHLEHKEKVQEGAVLGKRGRPESGDQQNKRAREGEEQKEEGGRSRVDAERRSSFNNRDRDRERDYSGNRGSRLSSVVSGGRREDSSRRDSFDSRSREEIRRPKLNSALGAHNPIPSFGEKPKPALDSSSEEMKSRNRKLFGVMVGTLQQFKSQIQRKTEADQRREQMQQKVEQRVKTEEATLKEDQRRQLAEQKAKELAAREEIKLLQEQKELELLNLKWGNHRSQLSVYLKTEAKPCIYFKPKSDPSVKRIKNESKDGSSETNNVQDQKPE